MVLVSVVVPVYKVEKYIDRCVKSILAQSLSDFELLLIDDGSSDDCSRICDEYVSLDDRVKIIHQENRGVSTARNIGLFQANGEYVVFIDGDDWIERNYLKNLYSVCVENGAQMALCDYVIAGDAAVEEKRAISEECSVLSRRQAIEFYAEIHLREGNSLFRSPWAKMIRRDIVCKYLFPVDREYAEDAACIYLWIWESEKIVHLNYCGYYYYQNSYFHVQI